MYEITDLRAENRSFFEDYIGADMTENIGRPFYRGVILSGEGNEPVAGMIWEIIGMGVPGKKRESEIRWVRVDKEDAFADMMDSYKDWIDEDEVSTSSIVVPAKDSKELRKLFQDAGFQMSLSESDRITVSLSELSEVELMKKLKEKPLPKSVKPLSEVRLKYLREAVNTCIRSDKMGICRDLANIPVRWFEPEVSCASHNGDEINGMFLFHRKPSGLLEAQILVCFDKNPQAVLPLLMRKFLDAMEENYDEDTLVAFDRHNMQTLLLAEKLFPNRIGLPVYAGSREEKG